jgi:hypothetical protein
MVQLAYFVRGKFRIAYKWDEKQLETRPLYHGSWSSKGLPNLHDGAASTASCRLLGVWILCLVQDSPDRWDLRCGSGSAKRSHSIAASSTYKVILRLAAEAYQSASEGGFHPKCANKRRSERGRNSSNESID